MPNRVIREGINDSKKINDLGFEAEVFYRRLFAVADDFGYFEAEVLILRSSLYKRLVDKISMDMVQSWLDKCVEVELIEVYEFEGKPYGQILNFGQSLRKMQSRYPNQDGKFITKDEYLKQMQAVETKSASKTISFKKEETKHNNMVDFFFADLPNSTFLSDACNRAEIKIYNILKTLPEFKKAARSNYKNMPELVDHFKNWYLKKLSEQEKTAVVIGPKKRGA